MLRRKVVSFYWTTWDCAQSSFEAGKSGYLALSSSFLPELRFWCTRTHNSSSNLGESTASAEIVKEWAQLIKDYRQDTIMCTDSYYLSGAGMGILRDSRSSHCRIAFL